MQTCLIVDDSRVIRKVCRRILATLGIAAQECADGAAALAICEREMPDLVLLDWNMPIMTGIEFLPRLRALAGGDRPKVIFCTTQTDATHIREAIAAGADEYVMKPFDFDTLQSKLQRVGCL